MPKFFNTGPSAGFCKAVKAPGNISRRNDPKWSEEDPEDTRWPSILSFIGNQGFIGNI